MREKRRPNHQCGGRGKHIEIKKLNRGANKTRYRNAGWRVGRCEVRWVGIGSWVA